MVIWSYWWSAWSLSFSSHTFGVILDRCCSPLMCCFLPIPHRPPKRTSSFLQKQVYFFGRYQSLSASQTKPFLLYCSHFVLSTIPETAIPSTPMDNPLHCCKSLWFKNSFLNPINSEVTGTKSRYSLYLNINLSLFHWTSLFHRESV